MHGAGSGPWIFEPWRCSFDGWRVEVVYGSETLEFPELTHWGLVLDRRIPEALAAAIARLWD